MIVIALSVLHYWLKAIFLRQIQQGGEWTDNEEKHNRINVLIIVSIRFKVLANYQALNLYISRDTEKIPITCQMIGANNIFYLQTGNYLQHNISLFVYVNIIPIIQVVKQESDVMIKTPQQANLKD